MNPLGLAVHDFFGDMYLRFLDYVGLLHCVGEIDRGEKTSSIRYTILLEGQAQLTRLAHDARNLIGLLSSSATLRCEGVEDLLPSGIVLYSVPYENVDHDCSFGWFNAEKIGASYVSWP